MKLLEAVNKKKFSVWAILIAVLITAVVSVCAVVGTIWAIGGTDGLTLLYAATLVDSRFVGAYDRGEMTDAALSGMVDALGDRWSLYMDPAYYESNLRWRSNAYVGIGITYQREEDGTGMAIVSVKAGSPAEAAGLLPGERIVAVDGVELRPDTFDETVASIAGDPGKVVGLTVEGTDGLRREVRVTLARVEDSPVTYELWENGIGYIQLDNFFDHCSKDTRAAVEDLQSQGARALLFDVRNNPGGYVSELTDLLDYLLPAGPIFTEHTKDGPTKTIQSDAGCVDLPMAVLVNADSYSAAELFAAQLRESAQAPLVGQVTCGKGYYQQALPLPNGGALNISTGEYGTGAGVSLIGTGLTPDVVEDDWDRQTQAAAALLLEKLGG